MQCVHPFYHKQHQVLLPCGKCLPCRLARAREWSIRIQHDIYQKETTASFITLTYADNPKSLSVKVLQDYIKRTREFLRRNFPDKLKSFAYFACGEYGEEKGRPHYHILFIGISAPWFRRHLKHTWSKGFIYIKPITLHRINYVTGYMRKKIKDMDDFCNLHDIHPPFQLQSQGIGKSYYEAHKYDLNKNGTVIYRGKEICMPRYYLYLMNRDEDPNFFFHPLRHESSRHRHLALAIRDWLRSDISSKYIDRGFYEDPDFIRMKSSVNHGEVLRNKLFDTILIVYQECYLKDLARYKSFLQLHKERLIHKGSL